MTTGDARCNACAATVQTLRVFERSVTSESKRLPVPSELGRCNACGLLQTRIELDLAAYYAQSYDATLSDDGMDEIVSTSDGKIVFRTDLDYGLMLRHAGALLESSADLSVLEFGFGRGRILSRLHKAGHQNLWAFDLAEDYRAGAERFCDKDRVFIGQPPPGPFDFICSFFVLEHDATVVGSLGYLHRALRPGGHLYLMLPNYLTNFVDLACADHVNHFSARYLGHLVETQGFDVVTLDDQSSIGTTALLARRAEREASPIARPELVAYADETVAEFTHLFDALERVVLQVDRERPIYLYGAGFYASLTHGMLSARGLSIAGIFDANPRKVGTPVLGVTVASVDTISAAPRDATLIVCVNPRIARGIAEKWSDCFARVLIIE